MSAAKRSGNVTEDSWKGLSQFTEARIALGRCGTSPPVAEILRFRKAHACARDAVHRQIDAAALARQLDGNGIEHLRVSSGVQNREEYLVRPDRGRYLDDESRDQIASYTHDGVKDICLILADGLSARAIHESGVSFVSEFLPCAINHGLRVAPVCIVRNGRVAIGDEIGELLQARIVVICIGERPGLKSPNSMGIYLTYNPRPGITDAFRNCISNVRIGGMNIGDAVTKTAYLVEAALIAGKTGVALKDRMGQGYLPFSGLDDGAGKTGIEV